jgi:hypothetical protein
VIGTRAGGVLEDRERLAAVGDQLDADALAGPVLQQAGPRPSESPARQLAHPVGVGDLQHLTAPLR